MAVALLDDLDDLGPTVDLVEGLALPFASLSLGRLLGIADDEAIRLGRLTRQVGGAFDQFATAAQHARTASAGAELVERLTVIVARQGGSNELLASLAGGGTSADEQELVSSAVLLFAAGVDSPASMVGLGTKLLLDHPDQASLLHGRPDPAPRAVAEILRYEPPVQLVARAALKPAELEGRQVPQGSMVFGLIAAGNRDPVQFKGAGGLRRDPGAGHLTHLRGWPALLPGRLPNGYAGRHPVPAVAAPISVHAAGRRPGVPDARLDAARPGPPPAHAELRAPVRCVSGRGHRARGVAGRRCRSVAFAIDATGARKESSNRKVSFLLGA